MLLFCMRPHTTSKHDGVEQQACHTPANQPNQSNATQRATKCTQGLLPQCTNEAARAFCTLHVLKGKAR